MKFIFMISLGALLLAGASVTHAIDERRLLRCEVDENGLSQITITQNNHGLEVSELYSDGREIRLPVQHSALDNGKVPLSPLKEKYRQLTRGSKGWALVTGSLMNWTPLKCDDFS
jgi:hypothetical protein